ncbi:ABC transporter permease [Achromobacter aloeverae]
MNPRYLVRLSWADLKHDRLVTFCMVASLVAVIAPLLLLFGLKYGVISTLRHQLLNDPRNLEIVMLSSGSYDDDWIAQLARRPEAGFVLGLTRSLNTQADLVRTSTQFVENADILPTAAGDPLLADVDIAGLGPGAVVLTEQASRRLGARVGDVLRLRISRRLDGRFEQGQLALKVHAVLPPQVYGRPAAFVRPELLRDMEWYRDGYAVPPLSSDGMDGTPVSEAKRRYAKARVYARDIDSVEALEHALTDMRIETASRLADIRNVKAIDRLLSTVFLVIAGTAVCGCLASLTGAFLANVKRKRREIATLRLIGLDARDVGFYVVAQAVVLTLFAFVLGLAAYGAGSAAFNHLLSLSQDTGRFACRVTPTHVVAALSLTFVVALAASLLGAASAQRIEPAESLREI